MGQALSILARWESWSRAKQTFIWDNEQPARLIGSIGKDRKRVTIRLPSGCRIVCRCATTNRGADWNPAKWTGSHVFGTHARGTRQRIRFWIEGYERPAHWIRNEARPAHWSDYRPAGLDSRQAFEEIAAAEAEKVNT